jgi:hypothetical protein
VQGSGVQASFARDHQVRFAKARRQVESFGDHLHTRADTRTQEGHESESQSSGRPGLAAEITPRCDDDREMAESAVGIATSPTTPSGV